jgi:hypothetical protein
MLNVTGFVTTFTGLSRSCCFYRHFITLIQSVKNNRGHVIHTFNPKEFQPTDAYDVSRMLQLDEIRLDHTLLQMFIYTTQKTNNCECATEEARYCMVLLLQ